MKLKYLVYTGSEYRLFTKKPKIKLKNRAIQCKTTGGIEIDITELWEMFYGRDYLYSGIIYQIENVIKSFPAFASIIEIARANYFTQTEGNDA